MTFYNISDVASFLKRISECRGRVFNPSNGQDMRGVAEYLLSSGMAQHMNDIDELSVTVEHPDDAARLMRFMAEGRRERRRAS